MSPARLWIYVALAILLALGILLSGGKPAATREEVTRLLDTSKTIMGQALAYPAGAPAKVSVAVITMEPGEERGWHKHDVPLIGYILEGELTIDFGPLGKRVFRKGEALVEAVGIVAQRAQPGDGRGAHPGRVHWRRGRAGHGGGAAASMKIARLRYDPCVARVAGQARMAVVQACLLRADVGIGARGRRWRPAPSSCACSDNSASQSLRSSRRALTTWMMSSWRWMRPWMRMRRALMTTLR